MKRKSIAEYAMETAKAHYVTSDYAGTKTSDPRDAEMRERDIVDRLESKRAYWLSQAELVSNMRRPESDNSFGRASVAFGDAKAEIIRLRAQVEALRAELNIVEERIPALVNVLEGGGNDVSAESWTIIRDRIRGALAASPLAPEEPVRHLTPAEQRILDRALIGSVKILGDEDA
jgi:hypothetical protein